jgi:hypothetical protein
MPVEKQFSLESLQPAGTTKGYYQTIDKKHNFERKRGFNQIHYMLKA